MLMRSAFLIFSNFVQVYSGLVILRIALSCIIIFMERRKPTSTLLWVLAINLIPVTGFILYLFIGQDLTKYKMFTEKGQVHDEIRLFFKERLDRIKDGTFVFKNKKTKEYEEMLEMFYASENGAFYQNNEIKVYNEGKEKFADLFEDIRNAKEAIYVQYYILKSDELGIELLELLMEKAQEGLEVLLLVDGMGARKFSFKYRKKIQEAGVKLAIFFPGILPKINTRINYRNHRKLVVVDYKIGYVGGLNVADEYVSRDKKFGFWRDTHLRITGPAVRGLQWRFFLDYRFASKEMSGGFLTPLEVDESGNKDICIVSSGPDTKAQAIRNGYSKMITRARHSIYIQTPYFVPDDGLLNDLKIAAMSGCEVNIMIPEKRDHPFVHWASMSFVGELLKWGVKAYLYKDGGFLHSKVVICDDYVSSVGTANFDIRSFELNFEVNAFIFDESINEELVRAFKEDITNSTEITMEDYNNRKIINRIKEGISRLLSPLL